MRPGSSADPHPLLEAALAPVDELGDRAHLGVRLPRSSRGRIALLERLRRVAPGGFGADAEADPDTDGARRPRTRARKCGGRRHERPCAA